MRRQPRRVARPLGARAHLLLLLAVLAGVVAMHGLGPSPVPAASRTTPVSGHVMATSAASCEHADHGGCGDSGHTEHADGMCAAGGTSGAPVLPGLASGAVVAAADSARPCLTPAARSGRGPPSLSELQLLRI